MNQRVIAGKPGLHQSCLYSFFASEHNGKVDQVNYQRQQFISGFVDEVEAKLVGY